MYFTGSSSTNTTDLIAFYRQHDPKPDARGRKLETMLSWSDRKLEDCHDYIQVIFPLPESSGFNNNAPIIDRNVFDAFNSNGGRVDLHKNLQRAFIRILAFYGFEMPKATIIAATAGQKNSNVEAEWAQNHEERFSNWVHPGHNHLRITRIIRSLRVLGRQDLAEILLKAVESVWNSPAYKPCSEESMDWWLKAFNWPLYSPPQGKDGDVGKGLVWLKQIVDAQSLKGPPRSMA